MDKGILELLVSFDETSSSPHGVVRGVAALSARFVLSERELATSMCSSSLSAWYRERHCLVVSASLDSTAAHPGLGATGPPSRLKDASLCWRRSRSRDPAQWSRCKHSLTPFFIQPHIPVFISTQVFKPLCSRVLWQVEGGGSIAPTRVEPPGEQSRLAAAAAAACRALFCSSRFKQLPGAAQHTRRAAAPRCNKVRPRFYSLPSFRRRGSVESEPAFLGVLSPS